MENVFPFVELLGSRGSGSTMPIMNYTTLISTAKIVGEIIGALTEIGASEITTDLDSSKIPIWSRFKVGIAGNELEFRMPCRWEGVFKVLEADPKVPSSLRSQEQARKVAWRKIKDWVEAQMAIIQSETAQMAEVFLPYLVLQAYGLTLFEEFSKQYLRLEQGDIVDWEVISQ